MKCSSVAYIRASYNCIHVASRHYIHCSFIAFSIIMSLGSDCLSNAFNLNRNPKNTDEHITKLRNCHTVGIS